MKRLKDLKTARLKLVDKVRDAALAVVRGALADLKEIGVHYHLVEGRAPRKGAPARKATAAVEAGACPVCGFTTSPTHDGRTHRYQDPKKAFTTAQLKAKGMSKVA